MAKKPRRTPEEQEYRDNLAHEVKNLRGKGNKGKELAQTLLEEKKLEPEYRNSLGLGGRKLDKDTADKLIKKGEGEVVVDHLTSYKGLDKNIAKKLIEEGYIQNVAYNLWSFENLDKEIAEILMKHGYVLNVYSFKERFENLTWEAIEPYIKSMYYSNDWERVVGVLADNLENCSWINQNELIKQLLLAGSRNPLGNTGYDRIMRNIEKFDKVDKKRLIEKLFQSGFDDDVLISLEKLEGVDYNRLKDYLIETGRGWVVDKYPEKFGLKK